MSNLSQKLASLSPWKLAAVTFAAVGLGTFGAMAVLFDAVVRQADTAQRVHVRDLVVAASVALDVEAHERLRSPEDFRGPVYLAVIAPLLDLHRASPNVQYMWTIRLDEADRQTFVLETSTDEDIRRRQVAAGRRQDVLTFLGPNSETERGRASLAELRAGRVVVFPGVYEDEHGAYIEGRAPLFDRSRKLVGYIGVDYALDSYERRLNEVRFIGAMALLAVLMVSFVIARSSYYMRQQSLAFLAAAQEQRDRAVKAEADKGHLIAVATHDLKNPLNAIAGMAGLWLQGRRAGAPAGPAEELEMVETIHASARHMSAIVSGILVNEGIEQGGLPFDPKPTDLSALVLEVVRFNTPVAAKKNILLESRVESGLRSSVDPRGLRECCDNYVSNAIKFSPPGRPVTIGLRRGPGNGEFEFFVQDHGPGLTPQDQTRVFGKFQRLSARPTGGEYSTGLGLSIVKAVVGQHGGTVGCDSTPGQGARFWLRCPLEPDPAAATSRSPRGAPEPL